MKKIKTDGPMQAEYAAWSGRARSACDKLIHKYRQTGVTPDPNSALWAELKELFLERIFCSRCAYCEARLPRANFPSHVEHYRPKKAVTEGRREIKHPGYFWLAYEWYNLLLVCHNCNTWHGESVSGIKTSHPGKSIEFPIQGCRVLTPADDPGQWRDQLRDEQPLLLNPYEDDPEKHIGFTEAGVPYAVNKCPRGEATIQICHLDRLELCADRLTYAEKEINVRLFKAIVNRQAVEMANMDFSLWMTFAIDFVIEQIRPR